LAADRQKTNAKFLHILMTQQNHGKTLAKPPSWVPPSSLSATFSSNYYPKPPKKMIERTFRGYPKTEATVENPPRK
jgi:hypothetical protein